jgi:hypothetical protein
MGFRGLSGNVGSFTFCCLLKCCYTEFPEFGYEQGTDSDIGDVVWLSIDDLLYARYGSFQRRWGGLF